MINQNNSCEKHSSNFPDFSLYDVDVDFELNDGKGAWVVVLRKHGNSRPALPDVDDYE